jgi:PAS domain S-box-containing protein
VAPLALLAMATLAGSWAFAHRVWRQARASRRDSLQQGKRYRALLLTAGDGIHVLDRGGRVVEASEAFGDMLGRSRAELLGMCITAWDLQSTPQSLAERFEHVAAAHRVTVHTQFRRADGRVIDVELLCVGTRIDGEELLYCSARDVTGRLAADEALRASQALLLSTGRVAGVGGWELDLADDTVTWSDETRRIHEVGDSYRPTVETGLSFYAEPAQPAILAALQQARQHGTPWDLELEFVTARGRALWVRTMGEVEFEQGEPARIVGAIQDISKRKRLEQALQDLNATLRAVLESIPASVVVVGVDLRYRFVNQSFERLQGKARAGVIGRPLVEVLGADEFEWRRPWIERALAGESVGFERLAPPGSPATHLSMSLVPLRLDSGEVDGFIGVAHDVTPQKQEQVRLLQLTLRDSLTGPLTPAEWAIMKTHTRLGADAISRAEAHAAQPMPFLSYAKQVALHHHERWDGSGYPDGLAGDAIPLAARLMAVADVFDALISRRAYKPAFSFEKAHGLMLEQRGRHFDPDLLDAFDAGFDDFCAIALAHTDEAPPPAEPAASGASVMASDVVAA